MEAVPPGPGGGGDGAGRLSAAAVARLARGLGDPGSAPADPDDPDAVQAWRAAIHASWGEGTEAHEAPHRRAVRGGVPVLLAGPVDAQITVVYLHGGGYVLGSAGVAVPITARLATRLRVVSVDYRLAPEHPYPAALDDAEAVFHAVRADHAMTTAKRSGPVALAGDSAGGALALGLAFRLALAGEPPPLGLLALCPHLEHRSGGATGRSAPDPGTAAMAALSARYLNAVSPGDPLVSPGLAPPEWLAALPPTLVQTGSLDPLWRSAARFVRRARAAGAPATLDLWDGLWHTWQYHRGLPEADRALAEAVSFLEALHQQPFPGQVR